MTNSKRAKSSTRPLAREEGDDGDQPDEPLDPAEALGDGSDGDAAVAGDAPAARRAGGLLPVAADPDLVSPGPRDPVARFMAEIRRYPRLSEDEERRLGRAVREAGDMDAARRLVVHNLRLVMSIANHYRRAWANILDLFQEGSVGLMEAVKRWEPSLGPRFGSYAAYWIRAYLLKFLMTNSRLIHVGNTRAGRKLFFRLEKERQKLLAAGFDPTPKLLAAKLDVSEHDLEEVGRHLDSREVSFDPRGGADSDEGYPLAERIPIEQASPEDSAASAEMSGNLHEVMGQFVDSLVDARERAVWTEHLAAEEPLSLGEIGARFGVSKQRMGQIADKLKKQFRDRVESRMGSDIRTDWLGEGD
ncbi:MAG TPA: sigma-70 family RNA polymerase sigma factor [Polyangia bacterium]|jgi:RNA polymerase sigma-32 factor